MQRIFTTKINVKRSLLFLSLLTIMLAIIAQPERYMESMRGGLLVFVSSILPALFPFFFVTRLMTSLHMGDSLSRLLETPMSRIYHAPPIAGYILLMSLMSGYPVGAKLIENAYRLGIIDTDDAKKIMPISSLPGPIFIVGTLGTGLLHDTRIGYIILISCVLGCLTNGLLYRGKKCTYSGDKSIVSPPLTSRNILEDTIEDSVMSILVVGGYISIFYVLSDILLDIGVVGVMTALLSPMTDAMGMGTLYPRGISLSLIEMTRGILVIKDDTSLIVKCIVSSGIVASGGLAILVQSMTYLASAKIKVSYYLLTKLTQTVFTLMYATILSSIFLL